MRPEEIGRHVSLRPFVTLRAGGEAEKFVEVRDVDALAGAASSAQLAGERATVIGWGSNVLPSDRGVPGLTILNRTSRIAVAKTGELLADSGAGFQEIFLKAAQSGLGGLEFAVGIPGTVGGALVSNAGAYRSCVSELLTGLEIVTEGSRRWVEPEWMRFSYRDSILRTDNPVQAAILRVAMRLPARDPKAIYDEARTYQRQRIGKQPPSASAGSFFKNVNDSVLARRLENLPVALREAGVVPAGFLIESAGLKGHRMGGAMLGARHANFILNVGGATATEIRRLACFANQRVLEQFGVALEEEVMYLGDWSHFEC